MKAWTLILDEIERYRGGMRTQPVQAVSPYDAQRVMLEKQFDFSKPVPPEELTAQVIDLLQKENLHVTHPRYFGLFNPAVHDAGIRADTLAALFNPQLAAWSHAPISNEMEQHTLRRLSVRIGYEPDRMSAHFTSGGAEANLTATLAALAYHFPEMLERGLAAGGVRPCFYMSGEGHHSFVKIARMTGLGTESIRMVPVDEAYRMHTGSLAAQIATDRANGWTPFMVVGTAGTTGGGFTDPLETIAAIAADEKLWFHVDAAWGGGALLSPAMRPALKGIERSDSVTWDAHKWLSVPMGAGMVFCRHPEAMKRAFAINTSYMPAKTDEAARTDPYTSTMQWSRRSIGLKVFMSLAENGLERYARIIEHQQEMADLLKKRLMEDGWLVNPHTGMAVVCFSHPVIETGTIGTQDVLAAVYERGNVWLSDVVLGGEKRFFRACITNWTTKQEDIDALVDELRECLKRAHA